MMTSVDTTRCKMMAHIESRHVQMSGYMRPPGINILSKSLKIIKDQEMQKASQQVFQNKLARGSVT